MNKPSEGGIGMLDVQSHFESLKAVWIPRLISQKSEHQAHWTEIPAYHLNTLGQNMYIIETTAYEEDSINKLPKFYQEVVGAYCKAKNIPYNEFKTDILQQPLLGNKHISCKRKRKNVIPYYINWINSGICYIKDLKLDNGIINVQHLYDKIEIKRNIHNEIAIMIKCLHPLLKGISNDPDENNAKCIDDQNPKLKKSKYFYHLILSCIKEPSKQYDK